VLGIDFRRSRAVTGCSFWISITPRLHHRGVVGGNGNYSVAGLEWALRSDLPLECPPLGLVPNGPLDEGGVRRRRLPPASLRFASYVQSPSGPGHGTVVH